MYKCLTLTYHNPSTHYRVYRCPPSPHHMQIPPRNIQMYIGACGHTDVWAIQMYGEHSNIWRVYECMGVYRHLLSLTNPMTASKVGASVVWVLNMSIILDVRNVYCSRIIGILHTYCSRTIDILTSKPIDIFHTQTNDVPTLDVCMGVVRLRRCLYTPCTFICTCPCNLFFWNKRCFMHLLF